MKHTFIAKNKALWMMTNATDSVSLMREWLYNNRSELATASIGTNLYGYSYDTIGNRLWSADNIITNSYSANSLNQYTLVGRAAPSAPQTTFVYDADGNMTGDGAYTYSYGAENRLRSVTDRVLTNGALRVLNAYDHRNRRIRKTLQQLHLSVAQPPALPVELREWETLEMRTFVYDDWNLIHEIVYTVESGVTNITEIQYFWGLDLSGTIQGAGGVGGLLAVSRNGQLYFPAYDNNGNVTKYIDETGNVVAAYEYDDFGRTISQSGPLADFFHHRFSTKYYDPETGLYYYGRRFYSIDWLVWLNHDPIEEFGGVNLFSFCENNPIHYIDAFGERISIMEDNLIVKDTISSVARAAFFPFADVSFSCSWRGVLHINGRASRRIEILTPNMSQWNLHMKRYDDKWGKDRSNTTEWRAARAHEMDHWNSFNSFFAFLQLLNDFDETNLCHKCNEVKDELQRQYNTRWNSAYQHSAMYDTDGFNYGGAYPHGRTKKR